IKYSNGTMDLSPSLFKTKNGDDAKFRQEGVKLLDAVRNSMDALSFDEALRAIWSFVRASNRYLDSTSPWKVAKDPSQNQRLKEILTHSLEALRLIALSVAPVMPHSAQIIWQRLGIERKLGSLTYNAEWQWGDTREPSRKVISGEPLFPRIEEARE
ncbi:MAG: class I tRNA ligase family protein, partial [Deltaproteobacteria bacterium]|nr:class I tRNA ligase family protein [Deltaproteobacteria bacterium]